MHARLDDVPADANAAPECSTDVREILRYFDQHRLAGELKSTDLALKGKGAVGSKREHLLKKKSALARLTSVDMV